MHVKKCVLHRGCAPTLGGSTVGAQMQWCCVVVGVAYGAGWVVVGSLSMPPSCPEIVGAPQKHTT